MPRRAKFKVGDRVRIRRDDPPYLLIGKMATVRRVQVRPGKKENFYTIDVDRAYEPPLDLIVTPGTSHPFSSLSKGKPIELPESHLEKLDSIDSGILANDLFLPWDIDLDSTRERHKAFTETRWLAGRIIELALMYDRVVIPTVDFSIIVPLIHWLGPKLLKEMLERESLVFVRCAGSLGYVGNGGGLSMFYLIPSTKNMNDEWWMRSARCSPREAVVLQVGHRLNGLAEDLVDTFGRLVELSTIETGLPEFVNKVEGETYRDIMGTDALRARYRAGSDLKRLPQIGLNQMRVFSSLSKPAVAGDPIDLVLRLGLMNLEAYLADEIATRDMVTDRGFGSLLSAKAARFTSGQVAKDAFSTLTSLEGLPDIPALATASSLDLVEAWKFRNSHSARQFRSWFSSHKAVGSQGMAQEYVRQLRDEGPWRAGPVKAMRFIAVQVSSIALSVGTGGDPLPGAIVGTGVGLAESYLLERIRLGFNPRYFLDDMRHRLFPQYPAF